jgi:hypothetical protein
LTSATVLYAELLLLRWIPANVVYIGFFSNFILMASFLGIGLGILLGRVLHPRVSPFPALLAIVVGVILHQKLELQFKSGNEVFFGLAESHAADANFIVLPIVFALVVVVLMAVALPLGGLLRSQPPLRAYALDIAGSIVGIVAFSVLAALSFPPSAWFGALAVLVVALELRRARRWPAALNAAIMVGVIYAAATFGHPGEVWSPYYRIYVQQAPGSDASIYVNGIPHQAMHPVSLAGPQPEVFYDRLYARFPGRVFAHALIIGAGSGTDVAYALANHVALIDAVDIDPTILDIGVQQHPNRPYDDPRVRRHVNDGRAYLRSDGERYDLIIFALPDSLTLVSTTANLRLESYLFTEEAFASARDHLTSDGVFVLYNYYRQAWLLDKVAEMLADVFGAPPAVSEFNVGLGSAAVLMSGPAIGGGGQRAAAAIAASIAPSPATDDWPFLYLRGRGIDPAYIAALGFVLAAAALGTFLVARESRTPVAAFSPHFFVLGVAFLLLETRSLATFGLLFGTTWLVNALVFVAILLSVLLAIAVNARWRPRRAPLYAGLAAAIGVAFVLPPSALLIDPAWLRYGLAAVVAFAPVFFANLVFTRSFQDTRSADMAFASNLIGATLGGVLEYSALITGYRGLLLVVAGLYLAALLLGSRIRVLGDRPGDGGMPPAPILAA